VAPSGMVFIPSFFKIGQLIQNLLGCLHTITNTGVHFLTLSLFPLLLPLAPSLSLCLIHSFHLVVGGGGRGQECVSPEGIKL